MGCGLLLLVSVGKPNLYLSAQPEITFFKIAYKRHTNYSIEPTPQYFKTTPDFGRRCTINIGKNADLLGSCYLLVQLPQIQMENYASNASNIKSFKWVDKIGLTLINFVEIEIGGNVVDRHYNDWLNIWYELTVGLGLRKSYDKMIGQVPELTEFSQTKDVYTLYIPFNFWFCLDTGLALPLIALTHNDIKFHIEFNDIAECYKISPSHYINVNENYCIFKEGELFTQTIGNNKIIGKFVYWDSINQLVYYNPVKGTFSVPSKNNDVNYVLTGSITKYKMNIKSNTVVTEDIGYFNFNTPSLISAYMIVNYIYLDNFERYNFYTQAHNYVITTVQTLPEQTANSINQIYKLPFYNPVKLITWRAVLQSNSDNNNKFIYSSMDNQQLINKSIIQINSNPIIDMNSYDFYTTIQKYQNDFVNSQLGINMWSFSLEPKAIQPTGTLNFSKLDDAFLQLTLNPIVTYQNPVILQAHALQYNLFKIENGIGALGFNI